MVYADLTSFFEMEVSSALAKQKLLGEIGVAQAEKQPAFEAEYNVYRLIIRYPEGAVELWDTMMHDDPYQVPCTLTLAGFLAALQAHSPPR
ncbi:hypothetical protein [Hymenobacter sp. B1770]|uniref:hypothetical protein n=1 Tax=Hymenobacter sp. B1770 TaxID=1718788 RepID=UPI003CE94A14